MGSQRDIVVVDKLQKAAAMMDVMIPRETNIRKKEHKNLRNTKN